MEILQIITQTFRDALLLMQQMTATIDIHDTPYQFIVGVQKQNQ